MDTRFLESFVSVADHGSLAAAAHRLGLTPAAIAQRIRVLEAEIDTRLLIRSGRTVITTEAGAAILARARNVLAEYRRLKSLAADSTLSGELRLGEVPSTTGGFLPDALKQMMHKHPQVVISSHEARHRIFIAASPVASWTPPSSLHHFCITEIVRVASAIRRAIYSVDTTIKANAQPKGDPEPGDIHSPATHRVDWAYCRRLLAQINIRPRCRVEAPGIAEIAVLVDRGVGVSIVPIPGCIGRKACRSGKRLSATNPSSAHRPGLGASLGSNPIGAGISRRGGRGSGARTPYPPFFAWYSSTSLRTWAATSAATAGRTPIIWPTDWRFAPSSSAAPRWRQATVLRGYVPDARATLPLQFPVYKDAG